MATEQRSQHQNRRVAERRLRERLESGSVYSDVLADQSWNWCEWRDSVTLPNGVKKSIKHVYAKGI